MPVSAVCPHCYASYSLDDLVAAGKCLVCGARLGSDVSAASVNVPQATPVSGTTDSESADVGRAPPVLNFLSPPTEPGEVGRLGRYRVLGVLGAGGMGIVLRAEDPGLRRAVAIKVLRPEYAVEPAARARFVREARAAAAVEHDHIVPIFQIDEAHGTAYLTMPLLKGESLSTAVRTGPMPMVQAVRIAREVAEGLAAAHENGLVHRDIKPGNIWLEGSRRRVKILDFGLARVTAESAAGETLTREGAVIGTPAYMSPEQARGFKVDGRSDLFSLGVVLYQLTTGQLPFRGTNSTAVLMSVVMDEPPPPAALNPSVPPALNDLIVGLVRKSPADRPATAAAVAQQLGAIEAGMSAAPLAIPAEVASAELGPSVFADLDSGSIVAPPVARSHAPRPTRAPRGLPPIRPVYLVASGAALVVLLGAGILLWQVFGSPARGTLVVESDDPAAEIVVRRDGEVVRERTRDREIRLRAGDYTVELASARDGARLSPDDVTVSRGGRTTVSIKVVAATPRPKTPKDPRLAKKDGPTPVEPKAAPPPTNGPTPPGGPLPPAYVPTAAPLPPWELPKGAPAPAVAPFTTAQAKQSQDAWAKHLGRQATEDNKLGMSFALVPPGEFDFRLTGNNQGHPPADVSSLRMRLTRPFFLGTTEVTVGQFEAFVKATGYKTEAEAFGEGGLTPEANPNPKATWRKPWWYDKVDPRHPVVQVSWHDAMAFCAWLGKQDGATYRLPTEAEWRFAARAGSTLKFGPADTAEDFRYHEWTADDKVEAGQPPYRPVGVKRANPFGLYDMLGNVEEWVLDGTRPELGRYLSPVDPVGPEAHAVAAGGSFVYSATAMSPEFRRWFDGRSARTYAVGFRVVREVAPTAKAGPVRVRSGQPLSARALVTRPEPVAGLQSWTVEPVGPLGNVAAIAWSPAGDRIASAHSEDHAVRLWDRSGAPVGILLGHDALVTAVAFSRDGKQLASAGDGVRVWDVATGECRRILPLWANRLAFSPDGTHLLVSGGSSGVFELATGRRIGPVAPYFAHADWSRDGLQLAVTTNAPGEPPAIWKQNPREKVADLKDPKDPKIDGIACWAVAWSPDGKWLATGRSSDVAVIQIWDAATHAVKATFNVPNAVSLVWHPDSRRLAVPGNGIWDALAGKSLADLADKNPFAWSPDGAEGISGTQFRAAATGQGLQSLSGRGYTMAGTYSLSPDGRHVLDATARPGRLRDAETGDVVATWPDLIPGSRVAWSPTGDRVAVWGQAGVPVRLVDSATGILRADLTDGVNCSRLAWAPDGKRVAMANGSEISVSDTAAGTRVSMVGGHTAAVVGLAWSPDGTRLASAGLDTTVRLWDPSTGKPAMTVPELPEPSPFSSNSEPLAWSADGRTVWVARNAFAAPLDVRTGRFGPLEQLNISNGLMALAAARDGKLLAKDASDWASLRAGEPAGRIALGPGLGYYPAWLPDSRRFLTGGNRSLVGFDTFARSRLGTLFPMIGGEHWLVIGPTGHYRGTAGVEPHVLYVAMHDDGSQRTYTPAEFAQKFGWKNDADKASLMRLDAEAAKVAAPPTEGYWPRLSALKAKGGRFWKTDGAEVNAPADLPAGAGLGKVAFTVPAGSAPLTDADADALRNLLAVEGTFRLEGVGLTDAGVARALGFAALGLLTDLELIDTPAGDEAVKAAAALPALLRLTLSGTQTTDTGVSALKSAKKLEAVDLRRTKVTEPAVKGLAAVLAGCRIEWDGGVIEAKK